MPRSGIRYIVEATAPPPQLVPPCYSSCPRTYTAASRSRNEHRENLILTISTTLTIDGRILALFYRIGSPRYHQQAHYLHFNDLS